MHQNGKQLLRISYKRLYLLHELQEPAETTPVPNGPLRGAVDNSEGGYKRCRDWLLVTGVKPASEFLDDLRR